MIGGQRLHDPIFAGLFPSTNRARCIDEDNVGAVGSKHPPNDRFHHPGIDDNRYRTHAHLAR
ncbi:hypothetical protein AN932_23350 [Mycobacterium intracellulare subsp. chimaera]|nr:hypothetical protein AN932_23350 [Mycobacterium intracellulare subsp. chimaera]